MNFDLNDFQIMLRDTAKTFFAKECQPKVVREVAEAGEGFSSRLWKQVAEMGWPGLTLPEQYGGTSLGAVDLCVVMEEAGRSLAPIPLWSHYLAASAILEAGADEQLQALLPGLASGEHVATLAVTEREGSWGASDGATRLTRTGAGYRVDGIKVYVPDAQAADTLLMLASDEAGNPALVALPRQAVTVSLLPGLDDTRRLCEVRAEGSVVEESAVLRAKVAETVDYVRLLGAGALAAEMLGGANRCLEMAVQYAKERYTFGRPIGSYQAIKHRCAEILSDLDGARALVYYAAWAAENDRQHLKIAARAAKAFCGDAFFRAASDNIQMHGGIGYTWEHDAHLYYKRAKLDQLLLGTSYDFREELADEVIATVG